MTVSMSSVPCIPMCPSAFLRRSTPVCPRRVIRLPGRSRLRKGSAMACASTGVSQLQEAAKLTKTWQRLRNHKVFHDAIPHPADRIGHPMHVKVACRRFQSKTNTSSFGWVYCGSHNFSPAAWGLLMQHPFDANKSCPVVNSSLDQQLRICNYELGSNSHEIF